VTPAEVSTGPAVKTSNPRLPPRGAGRAVGGIRTWAQKFWPQGQLEFDSTPIAGRVRAESRRAIRFLHRALIVAKGLRTAGVAPGGTRSAGAPPSSTCLSALRWCACTRLIRGMAARHGARPPVLAKRVGAEPGRLPSAAALRVQTSRWCPAIEPVAASTRRTLCRVSRPRLDCRPGVVAPWRGMLKLTTLDRTVGVAPRADASNPDRSATRSG
jgi:hypothetical protein